MFLKEKHKRISTAIRANLYASNIRIIVVSKKILVPIKPYIKELV